MRVNFSRYFSKFFDKQDAQIQDVIIEFVDYVETNGLKGLAGRNKSSAPQNPHSKKQRKTAKYAKKHCLWHYHLGIPEYVGEHGDMTSEYILHYQRFDDEIVIVDLTPHPPFNLPRDKIVGDV